MGTDCVTCRDDVILLSRKSLLACTLQQRALDRGNATVAGVMAPAPLQAVRRMVCIVLQYSGA